MNLAEYLYDIIKKENPSIRISESVVKDIVDWVNLQSMDREDTISTLACLLQSTGITEQHIEEYYIKQSLDEKELCIGE